MRETLFAVQLLDSVAKQQPEPHKVDINGVILLLCPNSISLATFYTLCVTQEGVPELGHQQTLGWLTDPCLVVHALAHRQVQPSLWILSLWGVFLQTAEGV